MAPLKPHTGTSDPVSFTCSCPASSDSSGGLILLFYRYYAASPSLPSQPAGDGPSTLAVFHANITEKLGLGGKIRVAEEGFNITVGGTRDAINIYMQECLSHWSFKGLDVSTEKDKLEFFKPSEGGCACAFGGAPANVRVASEITPMGVTNYIPKNWDDIEVLDPEIFHERCHSDPNILLLDVRNYYESRIGYFVNPRTGEPALRPPIRRFSQWPQYVRRYMTGEDDKHKAKEIPHGRQYLTFCTGGIRCEKGARYMQENMAKQPGDKVATLKGGIAAYLTWFDEECKQGKKGPDESLFKGKNYVFDARGSTSHNLESTPVSNCHQCTTPSYRLSKCRSAGCHLVLVVCGSCEASGDPRCCQNCYTMDIQAPSIEELTSRAGPRPVCTCEKEREALLWGEGSRKLPKAPKIRKINKPKTDIHVKVID